MKLKYFLNKIQDVKIKDYCSLFPMTIALIIRPFYKKKAVRIENKEVHVIYY